MSVCLSSLGPPWTPNCCENVVAFDVYATSQPVPPHNNTKHPLPPFKSTPLTTLSLFCPTLTMPSYRHRPNNDFEDEDGRKFRQPHGSAAKMRRSKAISLHSFSTKRGHDRAIEEFKKRKETKFLKNAALLREYSKAMKSEGYDAGKGASRKRNRDDGAGDGQKKEAQSTSLQESCKKRHKSDPLHAARKKAQHLKETQIEIHSKNKQRQQSEEQKMQHRKQRAKQMMKRTKKGQPLMKNVIGDLLEKIKGEVGDEGNGGY